MFDDYSQLRKQQCFENECRRLYQDLGKNAPRYRLEMSAKTKKTYCSEHWQMVPERLPEVRVKKALLFGDVNLIWINNDNSPVLVSTHSLVKYPL